MLRFTRPVSVDWQKWYLTQEDLNITVTTRDGESYELEWDDYLFEQPCSYVYIKLDIKGRIRGGLDRDNILTVTLLDSGSFKDENNFVVLGSVHQSVKAYLH